MLSTPGPKHGSNYSVASLRCCFWTNFHLIWLYLAYAVAVPVGNADLGVVTTTALANLFVAVAEMSSVCLVIPDLTGSI